MEQIIRGNELFQGRGYLKGAVSLELEIADFLLQLHKTEIAPELHQTSLWPSTTIMI